MLTKKNIEACLSFTKKHHNDSGTMPYGQINQK